eukprot:1804324-Rhodomonas_salina.3
MDEMSTAASTTSRSIPLSPSILSVDLGSTTIKHHDLSLELLGGAFVGSRSKAPRISCTVHLNLCRPPSPGSQAPWHAPSAVPHMV